MLRSPLMFPLPHVKLSGFPHVNLSKAFLGLLIYMKCENSGGDFVPPPVTIKKKTLALLVYLEVVVCRSRVRLQNLVPDGLALWVVCRIWLLL
jgi:hypothetical protein